MEGRWRNEYESREAKEIVADLSLDTSRRKGDMISTLEVEDW
jgi:hypothetical protein